MATNQTTTTSTPVLTESSAPKVIETTKQAVAVSTTAAPTASPTPSAPLDFESAIAKLKVSGTENEKNVIAQLEQYMEDVKPGKPVDGIAGARAQANLWRLIIMIIERSGGEFTKLYSILLAFFEKYKDGAFHEQYVFRWSNQMTLSPAELATFQRLLNLIKITAEPKARQQSLRQVDLKRTLQDVITETGRQRILGFYNK